MLKKMINLKLNTFLNNASVAIIKENHQNVREFFHEGKRETIIKTYDITWNKEWGIMVINPFPTQKEVEEFYSKAYFRSGEKDSGYGGSTAKAFDQITAISNYLKNKTKNVSMFDVGCGPGYFVNTAKKDFNFNASGSDFSKSAVDDAKIIFSLIEGKDIFCGELSNLYKKSLSEKKFDIITCMDALEHTLNPFAALAPIKKLLSNTGLLFIETPLCDSAYARNKGIEYWNEHCWEHVFIFSLPGLSKVLKEVDLMIRDIIYWKNSQNNKIYQMIIVGHRTADAEKIFEEILKQYLKI